MSQSEPIPVYHTAQKQNETILTAQRTHLCAPLHTVLLKMPPGLVLVNRIPAPAHYMRAPTVANPPYTFHMHPLTIPTLTLSTTYTIHPLQHMKPTHYAHPYTIHNLRYPPVTAHETHSLCPPLQPTMHPMYHPIITLILQQ